MTERSIGQLLQWLREGKGLSRPELGEKSGVDRAYIYRLEEGTNKHRISLRTVQLLAKGLGVPPEVFLLPEDCWTCEAYVLIEETLAQLRTTMRALVDGASKP